VPELISSCVMNMYKVIQKLKIRRREIIYQKILKNLAAGLRDRYMIEKM
jgi:hypothetical protein